MKQLILSFLAIFCLKISHAQLIPTFSMKDTVLTSSDCYLVDPGGFKSGYPGGTTVLTINSASDSIFGVSFEYLTLYDDNDRINIYDGNSTSAPLLTSVASGGGSRMVKSTGKSLTVQFVSYGYGTTGLVYGWKMRVSSLNPNPAPTQFQTVFNGFTNGNFDLLDYDHDGDSDVLNGGTVFRNDSKADSMFFFQKQYTAPIGQWASASMAKADFNGDGYPDIFVMGAYAPAYNAPTAKIYLNDKKGGFTASSQSFVGATNGRCAVLDYNHDGKPDISYIGSLNTISTAFTFRLYINNGDGTFTEKTTNVGGLCYSSLDWADADGDGDLDLVLNGQDQGSSYARYLRNDGNTFTEVNVGLRRSTAGEIRFTDIDGDGKPDIVNTGVTTPGNVDVIPVQLLINNGGNKFTALPNNLPGMRTTYLDWGDYDGDGDADLLMSGTNSLSPAAFVYRNEGQGQFTAIKLSDIESYSPVHWVDINGDHRLDAFVAGRNGYSFIAKNINKDSFSIATQPLPALDGTGAALIDDFNGDGVPDIIFAGSLIDFDCANGANSVFVQGLGWQYQLVPKLTPVATVSSGFSNPWWKWGDFDNDGKPDILVTNNSASDLAVGYTLKIFKNMGNNVFKQVYDGQPGGSTVKEAAVVDLDNDGRNELILAPNIVYRWNGSSFDFVYQGSSYCCGDFRMDFGDYNKDGYLDMAMNVNGSLHIYKNDRTGKLIEVIQQVQNFYQNAPFVKWVDMNKDGLLDLVCSNFILQNVGTDTFVYRIGNLPQYSAAAIGDFNKDSFPDIFGLTTAMGATHLGYSQGANFFYKEIDPPAAPGVGPYNPDAVAVDIDGDGDLDILHSTGECSYGILVNNGNFFQKNFRLVSPAGGEKAYAGSNYTIKWSGSQITDPVDIFFSADNGKTYQPVASSLASGSSGGNYSWQVPTTPSDSCLVKIASGGLTSLSRQVFSIVNSLDSPVLSSFPATLCQNATAPPITIFNYPNSDDGIVVLALLDSVPVNINTTAKTISIDVHALTIGKHTLIVKFERAPLTSATKIEFTIVGPVTPKVTITSSSTTIDNLSNPVVLTAANTAGGGANPLFTFATDYSFLHTIQAEGTATTCRIDPSLLNPGNNIFYVRMKTSDTCYTALAGIDSIVLIRRQSTDTTTAPDSLESPVLSSFPATLCQSAVAPPVTIVNYPNSAEGTAVLALLDSVPVNINTTAKTIGIETGTLTVGKHTLIVKFERASLTSVTRITFTISQAVLPKVIITASSTTITNPSTPVVLTAVNAGGGGTNPLFTFATDPSFYHIIQAEGSDGTCRIDPSSLNPGNNLVFVRMRTSDSCYAVAAGTDSIYLNKMLSAGIVDPDSPTARVIGAFPNPFKDRITLSGFNPAKTYGIILVNASGKEIYSITVKNSNSAYITTSQLIPGSYWVRVIDATHNTILGSLAVLKE